MGLQTAALCQHAPRVCDNGAISHTCGSARLPKFWSFLPRAPVARAVLMAGHASQGAGLNRLPEEIGAIQTVNIASAIPSARFSALLVEGDKGLGLENT